MLNISTDFPKWLTEWMAVKKMPLWGTADLDGFPVPSGEELGIAISFAIPVNPQIMLSIQTGPNQAYADEYSRVNNRIHALSGELAC